MIKNPTVNIEHIKQGLQQQNYGFVNDKMKQIKSLNNQDDLLNAIFIIKDYVNNNLQVIQTELNKIQENPSNIQNLFNIAVEMN